MLKLVTPLKVNVGQSKTGNTKGKDWTLWPVGIQVKEGEWINGAVFNQEDLDRIQTGKPIELDFYEDEYNGQKQWKFKLPKVDKFKALIERIERLENEVFNKPQPTTSEPEDSGFYPNITDGTDDSDLPF